MIWSTATSAMMGLVKKGALPSRQAVKSIFGLDESGLAIGRETEPANYVRWKGAQSEGSAHGTLPGEPVVAWREFVWSGPVTVDECEWGTVRWRFYSNGLVCFDAEMANSSTRLDTGDVQGHRIELREQNGLLLGVWVAGFFVRRALPMRGFAASFRDDHALLHLHFDAIAGTQSGACICL